MSHYPRLFSEVSIAGQRLRNRIVMGSMHTRLEHADDPIRRLAAFYAERARGGAAMIVTGGYAPNDAGLMEPGAPLLSRVDHAIALRPIADAIHAAGARSIVQILHAGRYARHDTLVAPSAIAAPINPKQPRAMTETDIERTISDYARCAELALQAGFDGVEIMGSEGYLINQFTALRTNRRDDAWGGSLENRLRFPLEIVRRVRAIVPAASIVMFRMSALDLVEGGLTGNEIAAQARALQEAGADALSTGIGWHEARVPTIAYMVPRAAWRFALANIKRSVTIPVVATNRINQPEIAEDILARGEADLVALARPLLADPEFPAKARAGRRHEINTCIACNQACLDYIFTNRTATCLVNPRAGREVDFGESHATSAQRIAVVGAGPAGLAFATTAADRGHRVVLYEAASRIGGQLLLAARVPGKGEYAELIRYYEAQLARLGVDVRLGTRVDASMLPGLGYDELVVATGVVPRRPAIEGIDLPNVVAYPELLSAAVAPGRRVAIIGAGGIAFDVAEALIQNDSASETTEGFLARWGIDSTTAHPGALTRSKPAARRHEVCMLQRRPNRPGERLGLSTGWILRAELKHAGVEILTGCDYRHIDGAGVHVTIDGEPRCVAADTVVVCAGQQADDTLASALRADSVACHVIGGARDAVGIDARRAIDEGYRLAREL